MPELPIRPASIWADKRSASYRDYRIRVGVILPGMSATDFARNAVRMTMTQTERYRTLPADPPEHVAEKILQAVETEAAEVHADSSRPSA
jgi:short-subunit dehydrogenase